MYDLSLDLENLVHRYRELGALGVGLALLVGEIAEYRSRGEVISNVAFCDRTLQGQTAFELAREGVRVFGHAERQANAADRLLIEYLEDGLPRSARTVVIGSGDHIFVEPARAIRAAGRRVIEVLADAVRVLRSGTPQPSISWAA